MKCVLILCAGLTAMAETSFHDLAKRFQNDGNQPAEERSVPIQGRVGVRMFDYSFASPVAARAPGMRKKMGEPLIQAYFEKFPWEDSAQLPATQRHRRYSFKMV